MTTPIVVPPMGCPNQDLTVSLWLARVGEQVIAGDRVVELLMPGIIFDVESSCSGTIASYECQPGTKVREGNVLGWIEPEQIDS
ncbi:biotin/lipoyl-containing protein [uncultured Gimesia sp.]|uniref:biotin/lipoyl-containing protein n=1 Tax=uncultured Gimesia sp. TaxID=1678688 RepID=UPI002613F49B|nr:biotin/lipoyl-containing protein [uncultured Gimesia sp.]